MSHTTDETQTQYPQPAVAERRFPYTRKPAAARRLEILKAASALLVEVGPSTLTLEQVADQVGIGKTTVYLYFPSRESLIEEATRALLASCVAEAARAIEGACPDRAVHQYCEGLFQSARRLPIELLAGVRLDGVGEGIDQYHARDFCGLLIDTVTQLIEGSKAPVPSPRAAARTVIAAVLTQAQWARRPNHFAPLLGAATDDLISDTLLTIGIAA